MSKHRVRHGSVAFKGRCIELKDHVADSRTETVTPVERPAATPLVGCMTGTVLRYDRPFAPVPGWWM